MKAQLLDCGHTESEHSDITTGYGMDAQGKKHCYGCCAEQDKKTMRETGRYTLYLDTKTRIVSNWPGSLKLDVYHLTGGRHNIAGRRYDVYFMFEGSRWHGVQYGDNTQICHIKRMKEGR